MLRTGTKCCTLDSFEMRVSRLELLPKDMLVKLLHTISEDYEGELKKQKLCTEKIMSTIRQDNDLFVWKCAHDGCPVISNANKEDKMVDCDACGEIDKDENRYFMLCPQHDRPDAWYYIAEPCDKLFPLSDDLCRVCVRCYNEYVLPHMTEGLLCSCVVHRK